MAEAVVSALVSTILGNFNSLALQELGVAAGLKTELEKLESIFKTVQAVVHDAEEKQWKSEAIKNWLTDLKDAAYDADDVLDEFATEVKRRRQHSDLTHRVRSSLSLSDNPLVFRVKMARKLKNVREKFDAIAKKSHDFHLTEGFWETEADSFDWRLTSSLVNESEILGRKEEEEELINMLLTNSDHDLPVYAVCGMGGLGKTTIAQLVYNNARVKAHFDLRIWVCVSDDFDIRRLARAIIESIDQGSPCSIQELDPLQRRLQEKVTGRRFLLILDDIWDHYHGKWNRLKDALRFGARGSAVVITTRIETVALEMESAFVQHLGRLSNADSLCLFERLAFGMRRREEYAHLESIGKAIVDKCGGVPLAIKAMGNLMRLKRNKSEWLSVKESELWDQQNEVRMVLSALKLSYNNLPPHLKQCFAFCSMFPKDYAMKRDRLIELWMANGFIPCKGQMGLHELGHQMFDELVDRSFFQDVEKDVLGTLTCKMHDLLHDLAQSITKQECCVIEGNRIPEVPKTVRLVAFFQGYSASCNEDLLKAKSLRSFYSIDVCGVPRHWRDDFSQYLSRQKHLRALNLNAFLFQKLPESIANMKYLRYLDVSRCYHLRTLPKSISSFQNLQTLNLRDCNSLYMLPKGMKHLKNLRYLDLRGCNALQCMPTGMGRLTCLQKLSIFIVGKEDGHHIGELQRLNLQGTLSIKNLDDVKGLADAQNANLMRKTNLQSLSLSWRGEVSRNISEKNSEDVLHGLEPHSNLKKVEISGYGGSKFPDWMMELLLPNLVEISLKACRNCEHLPPFGKLQFLKSLQLKGMNSVKCIGSEMYGNGENPFPSLERLYLGPMSSLQEWTTNATGGNEIFTCLDVLEIKNCPKLVELPIIPSVKALTIMNCSVTLLRSVMNFTFITYLSIEKFDELTHLPDGLLQNHTLLQRLYLRNLKSLKSLSNQLNNLSGLKSLGFYYCDELDSLPESLQNINSLQGLSLISLPITGLRDLPSSLASLYIHSCERFTSLSNGLENLTRLRRLHLYECPALKSLPESIEHLSSVEYLEIGECKGFSSLPNQIWLLTSLSTLRIRNCPNLMSLPEGSLNMLKELTIEDCPDLAKRISKKERGGEWSKIAYIPTVAINGQLLQSSEG